MAADSTHLAHNHHVQPVGMYWKVFAILLVLMVATIGVAQIEALKEYSFVNNCIAMGIAIFKATLVVLFFMGVKFSSNLTKIFVILGFSWFFMLFFMFCDYFTRSWEPVRGWEGAKQETAMPRDSRWSLIPDPKK